MANGVASWTDSIPWLIAIVGWGSTHLFSEARERRKEVRSQLDKATEQLLALEKTAREFHMAADFNATKAGDLRASINTLERKLNRISCLNMDSLNGQMIGIRRAITLENFEASSFQPQDTSSEVIASLAHAAADLEDALESQYRMRYPNTFPYFRLRKT